MRGPLDALSHTPRRDAADADERLRGEILRSSSEMTKP
jgi:hypothetical protein